MNIWLLISIVILGYISVSLNAYMNFKKAGLLNNEKLARKYYMYILFWPAYTNPLKVLAEKLFQHYGEAGHTYLGWDGLKNIFYDVVKGSDRYKGYSHHKFNFELTKSPEQDFETIKYALLNVSKKGDSILFICHLSEAPLRGMNFSKYDLDKCKPIDHQQLIQKLQSINLKYEDIEKVTSTIY